MSSIARTTFPFRQLLACFVILVSAALPSLACAVGAQAIAAGGIHTCALTTTGGVQCWGDNEFGQLGDNTTVDKLTPVAVNGLSSAVAAVVTGGGHTCALTSTGGVKCWGYNEYGQLGYNSTVDKLTPVAVSGLSSGVVAIAAGGIHTCALTSVGGVKCWGYNYSGQLGDTTTVDKLTPVVVSGLSSGVVAIAAGDAHTCALTSAGGVQCWGWNGSSDHTPVSVSGLNSGVVAITAGDYHTCALTSAGGVQCWGSNNYGQLGDNSTDSTLTPVAVSGLSSGALVVTAGAYHTCALTSVGNVKCWGANFVGQLGDTTTVDKLTPVSVSGLSSGVVAIAAGDSHTCALTSAGGVQCWGWNNYGQLGDNSVVTKYTPVNVVGFDTDGDGILDAADSDDDNDGVLDASDNCPVTVNADQLNTDGDAQGNVCDDDDDNDGVVDSRDLFPLDTSDWADADNDGIGDNADADDDNDGVPVVIDNCLLTPNADQADVDNNGKGNVCDLITTVVPISAGYFHNCALTSASGVKCWGLNNNGQLGDNTTVNKPTPVAVSGLSSGVAAVAAGNEHSCALTSVGSVKCWGWNNYGQLGDNTFVNKLAPVAVSGLSSGVAAVASGSTHTCALTSAGGVLCWGDNGYGQLGDNTTVQRLTPVAVTGLSSGVAAVAAGGDHTCALTSVGGVKCWGSNVNGRLGDNTTVSKRTPVAVSGLSNGVVAIAAGTYHSCALTVVGGVQCWGFNAYGQLGDNTTVGKLTPVVVSGLSSGVVAVAAGGSHTCALTSAGGVKCWGYNSSGQLGDSTTVQKLTPVAVSGLGSGVVAIAAGYSHTCALTSAGILKCWGSNFGTAPATMIGSFWVDSDGDTVPDSLDAFPLNAAESLDTDADGIGNNADLDDDGDGVPDYIDANPLNAGVNSETVLPLNNAYKGSQVRDVNAVQ